MNNFTNSSSVISSDTVIKGKIDFKGELLIEGKASGDILGDNLTLGPSAKVDGKRVSKPRKRVTWFFCLFCQIPNEIYKVSNVDNPSVLLDHSSASFAVRALSIFSSAPRSSLRTEPSSRRTPLESFRRSKSSSQRRTTTR